jgi:hypothetical protein
VCGEVNPPTLTEVGKMGEIMLILPLLKNLHKITEFPPKNTVILFKFMQIC